MASLIFIENLKYNITLFNGNKTILNVPLFAYTDVFSGSNSCPVSYLEGETFDVDFAAFQKSTVLGDRTSIDDTLNRDSCIFDNIDFKIKLTSMTTNELSFYIYYQNILILNCYTTNRASSYFRNGFMFFATDTNNKLKLCYLLLSAQPLYGTYTNITDAVLGVSFAHAVFTFSRNDSSTIFYNDSTYDDEIQELFNLHIKDNADPYSQGGTSEPGGGGGSFDDSTDVITIPEYDPVDLLNRSYGNRGFVHVYLPTQAELTSLHAFMWNNSLITEMQKMFNNVADAVISLNLLPLDFTDATPNRGNILMGLVDSQIETTIAKQQFVTLDCGTIEINEFFASYLDYSPYSKLQIYLPYIGVKDLDIDEFMNAYISVKYVIDIVSGACVAFISKTGAIDNDVVQNNPILGVLYQFAGNCALNVPISGANYAQVHAADIGALIGGAGVLGTFLTGGMSAPAAVTGILSTAANVVTSKPAISRGGSIPSTVGYMSIQKPYLILTRPRMCLPEDQNTFTGYPAYVTMTPGDTSGYTEFEIIHLENIPATDAEKNELETLMKTGVIL